MALGPQFRQGQLFNPASTRPRDPGEMSPDAWLGRRDVAYHGTLRPEDWTNASENHFGTLGAAEGRIGHLTNRINAGDDSLARHYFNGPDMDDDGGYENDEDEGPNHPTTGVGQVFARRLTNFHSGPIHSDAVANSAQNEMAWDRGEDVSASVQGSATANLDEDHPAFKQLAAGATLRYKNDSWEEHAGSTSYIAPHENQHSWMDDVLDSRHAAPLAQQFARQMHQRGQDLPVGRRFAWGTE